MMKHSKYLLNTTTAFKLFNQKTGISPGYALSSLLFPFLGPKEVSIILMQVLGNGLNWP